MKIFIFLSLIFALTLHAQDDAAVEKRPMLYPFDVTIGGQKAVMQEDNILFAVIENPVKADDLLEIEKEAPMLIINAFIVNEKGEVMKPGQQPAIIFTRATKSVRLNATMDKKPLQPGRYLANIVANGTTSRVVFVIKDKTGKMKIPSLDDLENYLRKQNPNT